MYVEQLECHLPALSPHSCLLHLGLLLVHALAGGERDFEELLAEARQHLVFVFVASSACVALCAC